MLSGVAKLEERTIVEFPHVLALATATLDGAHFFETAGATWRCAVVSTVTGFQSWCSRSDIETAVLWVAENLPHLFKPPAIAN